MPKWKKSPRDTGVGIVSPSGHLLYSVLPRNVRQACASRAWELTRHKRRALSAGIVPTPSERACQRAAFEECRSQVEVHAKTRLFAGDSTPAVLRSIESFEASDDESVETFAESVEGFASRVSRARERDTSEWSPGSRRTRLFERAMRDLAWVKP